jgi:hypothetical protein
MRSLLCYCRRHLEAQDEMALVCVMPHHAVRGHPALPPIDEQPATRVYRVFCVAPEASL